MQIITARAEFKLILKTFFSKKTVVLLLIAAYFIIAYSLLNYFNISCVFLEITGIPCPGCGMTRAFLSLVTMDFYQAIKHNVVIFFMPYVFIYLIFELKHRVYDILLITIAVIAIVNWIIKIFLFV